MTELCEPVEALTQQHNQRYKPSQRQCTHVSHAFSGQQDNMNLQTTPVQRRSWELPTSHNGTPSTQKPGAPSNQTCAIQTGPMQDSSLCYVPEQNAHRLMRVPSHRACCAHSTLPPRPCLCSHRSALATAPCMPETSKKPFQVRRPPSAPSRVGTGEIGTSGW
jgi:hypothetical protein